jgi:hypothetical protein
MQSFFFPLSLPCNLFHCQIWAYPSSFTISKACSTCNNPPLYSLRYCFLYHYHQHLWLMKLWVSERASSQSPPPQQQRYQKGSMSSEKELSVCFQGQTESMYSGNSFLVGACRQTFFIHLVYTYYIHTYKHTCAIVMNFFIIIYNNSSIT